MMEKQGSWPFIVLPPSSTTFFSSLLFHFMIHMHYRCCIAAISMNVLNFFDFFFIVELVGNVAYGNDSGSVTCL